MRECSIVRRGGGGGSSDLFAAIGVTYPEGSTCTCTNGTKTLTAKNTSGQWVFAIPEPKTLPETWTVTATDGTNTKSQSVSISTEGQFESVELAYAIDLYNSTITSGWAVKKRIDDSGTGSISSGKMVLDGAMAYGGAANLYTSFYYYKTKVECSADKKLKIEVTKRTASAKLIIVSSLADATNEGYNDVNAVASAEISGTGTTSLTLVDGSYYIGVLFNANAYIEATRVWIE